MKVKILYVERHPNEYVSLEKVFRRIVGSLSPKFEAAFQQTPYGLTAIDTIRNLLLFRKRPADIYHITGHIHYIALLFSPENTALTIHDLRFLNVQGRLRRYVLKKLYLDLPIRRLKFLTTVSEQVKKEIIENTDCDPAKIRVLDLPLFDQFAQIPEKQFDSTCPVVLQVGTMPNKNVENLARALENMNCKLRIVGRLSDAQIRVLGECGIKYENLRDLTDEEIRIEYLNADIVTFCSTYEGFGLPIIEGQAAGKPIVTSDLSPLKETAGGAACFVDPYDKESIRCGIKRVFEDSEYRDELVKAGFRNVERFKPDHVVKQYETFYTQMLSNISLKE